MLSYCVIGSQNVIDFGYWILLVIHSQASSMNTMNAFADEANRRYVKAKVEMLKMRKNMYWPGDTAI